MKAATVVVALVGIQFLLLALNALLQALSRAGQQLLNDRVGMYVQMLIMEHAATLDLAFFEDAKSYDMLQQAQQEARLLELDEPSAALDAQAEHDLFQRLRTLAAGRTTIFISHRFSTVRQSDRILVLEEGRLIEQGTRSPDGARRPLRPPLPAASRRLCRRRRGGGRRGSTVTSVAPFRQHTLMLSAACSKQTVNS